MEGSDSPFVYCFKTENNHYIYDVNTNRVFRVSNIEYDIVSNGCELSAQSIRREFSSKYPEEMLLGAIDSIINARRNGYFDASRPSVMAYGIDLKNALESKSIGQLVLSLTEKCNLRCSYCVYSGAYDGKRRHSNQCMSESTANMALDYFLKNCTEKPFIGFYGGEPLIAFREVQRIVAYVKKKYGKKISFSITTNGTLLNDEIIQFLFINDFYLTVSLDGPEHIHDRCRKTVNGKGTWKTVMNQLQRIKDLYPAYYDSNVIFSVVNAPPLEIQSTARFFEDNALVRNIPIVSAFVDAIGNSSCQELEPALEETNDFETFLKAYIKKSAEKENMSQYLKEFYDKNIISFYHRTKTKLDTLFPNGCCIPGIRRLFVDSRGIFYACEKTEGSYAIGDVKSGIDSKKVEQVVSEYVAMSKSCFNCWACRQCTNCFYSFIKNSKLCSETREDVCRSVREQLSDTLYIYYSLLESDHHIFDHIEHASIS